jgi:ATP-dependent exoDNAse (exonuclease V) beta subunit
MTRARERLVLCGCWPEHPRPVDPAEARALIDLVTHRAPAGLLEELAGQGDGDGIAERASPEAGSGEILDGHGTRWFMLRPEPDGSRAGGDAGETGSEASVARDGSIRVWTDLERLRVLRGRALARQARPLVAAASAESHQRLEREQLAQRMGADRPSLLAMADRAGGDGVDDEPALAGSQDEREVARQVGTAVHLLLETLDLGRPLAAQVEERRQVLLAGPGADDGAWSQVRLAGAARERLDEILARLVHGRCLQRLEQVKPRVVARELPLLAAPGDPGSDGGALGAISGAADMVYEEGSPGTDGHRLVVVDFKTDRVAGTGAAEARARLYASQGQLYAHALTEALELARPPRIELWFLVADEIVEVSGA